MEKGNVKENSVMENDCAKLEYVYCIVCLGHIVGIYASYDDAVDVQKISIANGWPCNLIPKVIIYS